MQDFEQRALTTTPLKPSLWLRYMDDTFVIWKHGDRELQSFLEHLNGQCAEIQFTMEKETKGSLLFLNVRVKKDGSKLATSVYRKPTHVDRYLNCSSHHHPKVKSGIADCLHHRAKRICQWGSALADEKMHVQKVLMANGYPKKVVVKCCERKTRDDGCEGCGVLNSLCWVLSHLCWRDREDTESPYGRAQKGSQEQGS